MKIIKEGKIPTTTIRFYCGNCGCVFECEKGEYTYYGDQRDRDYYTAKCPTCGKRVYNDVVTVKECKTRDLPGISSQRMSEYIKEYITMNKKDRITFVVHMMSDYDLRQAQENILTSLPDIPGILNMPRCIDIPGIEIFFRCGDPERCLGGLRPDYYVSNSIAGLEFLRQSAEKCGGKRLKDIDELRNKAIELVNSFCR